MTTPTPPDESRLFVASFARGLTILTAFWEGKPSMNLAELAAASGMTKSAAQRFAHTLFAIGYLRKDPATKEYSLAPRSLEVGLRYLQTSALVNTATPYLHALTRACEETSTLAEREGLEMVYVARFPTHREMFVNMPLGTRLPMYCMAAGRAVMSLLTEQEVRDILQRSKLESFTPTTITGIDDILARVRQARDEGFAWTDGEFYQGDITISAPILGPAGEVLGAISASAPSSRRSLEQARSDLAPQVMEAARSIGATTVHRQPRGPVRRD